MGRISVIKFAFSHEGRVAGNIGEDTMFVLNRGVHESRTDKCGKYGCRKAVVTSR